MPLIEPDALGRLYRQHAPALLLYARQWPGNGEDLVHDAFVKLARQSSQPARILPWLYRVVRNTALTAHRSAVRRRRREGETGAHEVWFAAVDDQIDAQDAVHCLSGLALELREVIAARIWGGLTFDEIAQLVGCSLPTAQRRYQAGLTELRKRMDGQWKRNLPLPTT